VPDQSTQAGMGTPNKLKRIPRPIFPPVQERETRPVNFRLRCYFLAVSRTVSLAPPTAFCTLPAAFSAAPSVCVLVSPVTLPTVSFTAPHCSCGAPNRFGNLVGVIQPVSKDRKVSYSLVADDWWEP
jgi:hypothetical protein